MTLVQAEDRSVPCMLGFPWIWCWSGVLTNVLPWAGEQTGGGVIFHLGMSFPRPCEGDLGPLCRIRNLDAFLSALYFYHIDDTNQNKTWPKKREGRCSPPSCQLSTLKWFVVRYALEPVAVPWEGNLWLSWGQLMAINTPRKSSVPAAKGRG